MPTAQLIQENPRGYYSGAQHWRTSDGHDYIVIVDDGIPDNLAPGLQETLAVLQQQDCGDGSFCHPENIEQPSFPVAFDKVIVQPTMIIEVAEDGEVKGDTMPEAKFTFAPKTTHEDALMQLGYTIQK